MFKKKLAAVFALNALIEVMNYRLYTAYEK